MKTIEMILAFLDLAFAIYQEYKQLKSEEQRTKFQRAILSAAQNAQREAKKESDELIKNPAQLSDDTDRMLSP